MARRSHRVDLTRQALRDLASARNRIARDSPLTVNKWLQGIRRTMASLGHQPPRFEVIPEAAVYAFPHEYRHVGQGGYRIIYLVEERRVLIVRVIHAARLIQEGMLPDELLP